MVRVARLAAAGGGDQVVMDELRRVEDLSAAEIRAMLDADGGDLCRRDLLAVERFVARVGGMANARLAVDLLGRLEGPADG